MMASPETKEHWRPTVGTLDTILEEDDAAVAPTVRGDERGDAGAGECGDHTTRLDSVEGPAREVKKATALLANGCDETHGNTATDDDEKSAAPAAESCLASDNSRASDNTSTDNRSSENNDGGCGEDEDQPVSDNDQQALTEVSEEQLWNDLDTALAFERNSRGVRVPGSSRKPIRTRDLFSQSSALQRRPSSNPSRSRPSLVEQVLTLPHYFRQDLLPTLPLPNSSRARHRPRSQPRSRSQPRPQPQPTPQPTPQPPPPPPSLSMPPPANGEPSSSPSPAPSQIPGEAQNTTTTASPTSQRPAHLRINLRIDLHLNLHFVSPQARQPQPQPQTSPQDDTTAAANTMAPVLSQKLPNQERNYPVAAAAGGLLSARTDYIPLLDRHNRAIAQILTRFRNMVLAAAEPLPQTAVIETAALNRLTMEREAAALITEVEGLLALNREIKALWIRGPLRLPGEDDGREAEIDRKAELVTSLYGQIVDMKNRMAADKPAAQPHPRQQEQQQQ